MRSLLVALLLSFAGSASAAEPADLSDRAPRWIEVAFEVSPRDKPAQVDTFYTPKIRARLEAGDGPGLTRVTIDRRDVERVLLADDDPVAGSFSDFVWVFDSATGEVLTASLSGIVRKQVDWGLFRTTVRTRIEADMATNRVGGFEEPRNWLGHQIFGYCNGASGGDRRCTPVAPNGYDFASGYVNAVGALSVRLGDLSLRTFSPLGEAVFTELERPDLSASSDSAAVPFEEATNREIVTAGSVRPPPFDSPRQSDR